MGSRERANRSSRRQSPEAEQQPSEPPQVEGSSGKLKGTVRIQHIKRADILKMSHTKNIMDMLMAAKQGALERKK